MRTMSYRIELEKDDGYIIANSSDDLDTIPTTESFFNPPLRIVDIGIRCCVTDPDYILKLEDYLEVVDSSDHVDEGFRQCYRKALYKETNGWRLIAIEISRFGVYFWFGNRESRRAELLRLKTEDDFYLRLMLHAPRSDGGTDQYLLARGDTVSSPGRYSLCVTEYNFDFHGGRREISFDRGVEHDKDHPDPEWEYAYVKEYR